MASWDISVLLPRYLFFFFLHFFYVLAFGHTILQSSWTAALVGWWTSWKKMHKSFFQLTTPVCVCISPFCACECCIHFPGLGSLASYNQHIPVDKLWADFFSLSTPLSVRPSENNSECSSLSDSPVSSGVEDVVVSPQHVQHLPSLPHWWEWLEGTYPDRVGGYGPFHWKHSSQRRQTSTLCYCCALLRYLLNLWHLFICHATHTQQL